MNQQNWILLENKKIKLFAYNNHLSIINGNSKKLLYIPKASDKWYFPSWKARKQSEKCRILCNNITELKIAMNKYLSLDEKVDIFFPHLNTALDWLIHKKRILPIMLGTTHRDLFSLKVKNITIRDLSSDNTGKVIVKDKKELDLFSEHFEQAKAILTCPENKSVYSTSLLKTFLTYPRTALIGSFDNKKKYDTFELDFNKFYPSMLYQLKKFPKFSPNDVFKPYINGEPLSDYNIYLIKGWGEQEGYDCYLSDDTCLVSGMTLKLYDKNRYIIRQVCKPSQLVPNKFKLYIDKIVKSDLPEHIIKLLLNMMCGIIEKTKNKVVEKFTTSLYSEAVYLRNDLGGGNIVNISEPENPIWLVEPNISTYMSEGFYPIKFMIYDMCRWELYQLHKTLTNQGCHVVGVHTDCLYVEKNEKANVILDEYELYKDGYKDSDWIINWGKGFEWGTVKYNDKQMSESLLTWNNRFRKIELPDDKKEKKEKKEIKTTLHMKNEYDKKEFLRFFKNHKRLFISAKLAGSGKTELCKAIPDVLFVCPDNRTCSELKKEGFEAITCHRFFGKGTRGESLFPFSMKPNHKVIVFEEIFKNSLDTMNWIDNFVRKTNKKVVCNGDPHQLAGVNPNINKEVETIIKMRDWINELFPVKLALLENKSVKDPKQKRLMNEMYDDMWENKLSIEQFCNKYLQTITHCKDAPKDARYITQKNETNARIHNYYYGKRIYPWRKGLSLTCVRQIKDQPFKKNKAYKIERIEKGQIFFKTGESVDINLLWHHFTYRGDKPFCVGMQVICKKKLSGYDYLRIYEIKSCGNGSFVFTTGEKITRAKLFKHFTYCKGITGYGVQGMRFSEPVVLCDLDSRTPRHFIWTAITRARDLQQVYRLHCYFDDNITNNKIKEKIKEAAKRHYCTLLPIDIRNMLKNQEYRCNHCGGLLTNKTMSLHRIDNNLDYYVNNVELLHWECNRKIR